MTAQDKPRYVAESRNLLKSLDIEALIFDPNNLQEIKRINRLIAIFMHFSYNDGEKLRSLLFEFQRWGRRSTHMGIIRNRAIDMFQFIGQKIEEMDIYIIEPDEKPLLDTLDKLRKSPNS